MMACLGLPFDSIWAFVSKCLPFSLKLILFCFFDGAPGAGIRFYFYFRLLVFWEGKGIILRRGIRIESCWSHHWRNESWGKVVVGLSVMYGSADNRGKTSNVRYKRTIL
jgi:hypothetical protein